MKVGSLVIMVGNLTRPLYEIEINAGVVLPNKGDIYTVREIIDDGDGLLALTLEEIRNPIINYSIGPDELRFLMSHFRELQPPMDLTELLEETVTA